MTAFDDASRAELEDEIAALRAENAALSLSESQFRSLQDASLIGSTLYRPIMNDAGRVLDFEWLYMNAAGARIAGGAPSDFVGKRLLEVYPFAAPNGIFSRYAQVVEEQRSLEWTARDPRNDVQLGVHFIAAPVGNLLHISFRDVTAALDHDTERDQLLAAANTATSEWRIAESHLRNLFEQAPIAIAVFRGPNLIYEIASPEYIRTAGNGRALLGRPMLEAFPELAATDLPAILQGVYRTGRPYRGFERRVMLDDQQDGVLHEHFFNIGYKPLYDSDGNVYAIASVLYEVTEQIRARQLVEASRAAAEDARIEAEAANKAKGEFLAIMSHELRTPLNAIGGYAELIAIGVHGPVNDAQRTALDRIQLSQRHLLGLINGVLNYSRVEAGAVTYDLSTVNVARAVAEAESLVSPQLRAKDLDFRSVACPSDINVIVDPDKLQQILLNLLSNAVKFTNGRDNERGCVEASCERRGASALLHISDNGIGIDADRLRSVFEPFVQIDQRLTRRQEGVGLGLTISRDLARGMGGDLLAASTPGEGSVFTLVLPAA